MVKIHSLYVVCKPILVFSLSLGQAEQQAGTELCQAQLKLASSLFCFQLKDKLGSLFDDLKNVTWNI